MQENFLDSLRQDLTIDFLEITAHNFLAFSD
jgi:hypothetical protein